MHQHRLHGLGASQQRAQPGEQFAEIERLHEIIVGAGVESGDAIDYGFARREHEDGGVDASRAQRLHHAEPIGAWQHDIEHNGVVAVHGGLGDGMSSVGAGIHGIRLLAEATGNEGGQPRIIFDDENAHAIGRPGGSGVLL